VRVVDASDIVSPALWDGLDVTVRSDSASQLALKALARPIMWTLRGRYVW